MERKALELLAAIALTEANGNSEPDVMAAALDDIVSKAQWFFYATGLNIADYTH